MQQQNSLKLTKNNLLLNKIYLFIVVAIFIFSINACSKKLTFLTSSVVPAAEGTIQINKDKNNNYKVKIVLSNLADPGRLTPPVQSYVVWMMTDDYTSKNIGQIKTGASMFSKHLKAKFETVSSVKPTRIFITAEDDASIQYPGSTIVLTSDDFLSWKDQ
ncbi:MAG: hypothetical protein SH818_14855 [Saprospiraceae bacterium]|nr:hypothetical protein [Saprospiraceae bacterium]